MKRFVTALVLSCSIVTAPGAEWIDHSTIRLTDDEAEACKEPDNCFVFTKAEIAAMLSVHEQIVWAKARKACVFGGVGRDS